MPIDNNRLIAEWILEQVGTVNPYNRQGSNMKSEYYIYEGGYLAAYLGSLMLEDPYIRKRFGAHIRSQRGPAAKNTKRG